MFLSVAPHPRDAVWRANMRLIASLLKTWTQVRLDKMPLLHMLNRGDGKSASYLSPADRVVATSLTVFLALLANGVRVLDPVHDASIPPDKFYDM